MVIQLTNKSNNFYAHLGPIFGSRKVQKMTGDRFYDDDEKVWFIYFNRGTPTAFVSVEDNVIKNVWSEQENYLVAVLKEVNSKVTVEESVVPIIFQKSYQAAGFTQLEGKSKNFIKIRGVQDGKN